MRERSASVDGALSTAGTVNAGEESQPRCPEGTGSGLTSRVGEGSIVGLVTIIVSLCITFIVSDFGLIVIVRGLHCVNYCMNSGHCLNVPGRASRF